MKRIFILFFLFAITSAQAAEDLSVVPQITAAEAYAKFKKGDAILVDAMNPGTYAKNHILGAVNLPNNGAKDIQALRDLALPFPEQTEFIVYCE